MKKCLLLFYLFILLQTRKNLYPIDMIQDDKDEGNKQPQNIEKKHEDRFLRKSNEETQQRVATAKVSKKNKS